MQNLNKPLFSGHYLEFHLPESPEWQLDPSPIFAQLKSFCVDSDFFNLSLPKREFGLVLLFDCLTLSTYLTILKHLKFVFELLYKPR